MPLNGANSVESVWDQHLHVRKDMPVQHIFEGCRQVVVDLANFDEEMLKLITTGACISVNGEMVESVGSG